MQWGKPSTIGYCRIYGRTRGEGDARRTCTSIDQLINCSILNLPASCNCGRKGNNSVTIVCRVQFGEFTVFADESLGCVFRCVGNKLCFVGCGEMVVTWIKQKRDHLQQFSNKSSKYKPGLLGGFDKLELSCHVHFPLLVTSVALTHSWSVSAKPKSWKVSLIVGVEQKTRFKLTLQRKL
jgi:hypothetical protein